MFFDFSFLRVCCGDFFWFLLILFFIDKYESYLFREIGILKKWLELYFVVSILNLFIFCI